jgi:hemoglobin
MAMQTSVNFNADAVSIPIAMPVVTEEMIDELVRAFYGRVRVDPDLGPIFEGAIDDWEPHLAKMVSFWSAVMLKTRRYKGSPVVKHNALSALRPEHFEIWLGLFRVTARDVCPELIAETFINRAETIGESLKLARFGMPGVPR